MAKVLGREHPGHRAVVALERVDLAAEDDLAIGSSLDGEAVTRADAGRGKRLDGERDLILAADAGVATAARLSLYSVDHESTGSPLERKRDNSFRRSIASSVRFK